MLGYIILKTIKRCTRTISEFFPDAILSFSCAGRFTYWGEDFISRETLPFQAIAPTDGFYTGSEFGRWNGPMLQHNLTLVLAAIREGDKPDGVPVQAPVDDAEFDRQMAIVSKLAAFVGVTSTELESAYAQMRCLATTDGLTGILNRGEMEKRMRQLIPDLPVTGVSAYEPSETAPCIVMIGLDKFKSVNDIYGHKAGDEVLVGMGEILRELVDEAGIGQSARWGGEEFMALLTSCSIEDAREVANAIRVRFSKTNFMHSGLHTLSAGVAKPLPRESVDLVCQRVDKALYAAKKNGRNCVVVA